MSFFILCEEEDFPQENIQAVENVLSDFVKADCDVAVEFLFVDGEEIRRLNRETRNTDKVTDVLSFPSLDGIKGKAIVGEEYPYEMDEEGRLLLGSIVVCMDRAKEQAEEYGHSLRRELHYLLVHGILHCLGYDHIEEADKTEMRKKEEEILGKLGIVRA